MKSKIQKAKCVCAECALYETLKTDPQLRAMRILLKSRMDMSSEDKAEILHYIRERKLEILRRDS